MNISGYIVTKNGNTVATYVSHGTAERMVKNLDCYYPDADISLRKGSIRVTNAHIVEATTAGIPVDAGNFSLMLSFLPVGLGWLPDRLKTIAYERFDYVDRVIYSYGTPIAWRDSGVWIVPDVRYSTMTSSKHQAPVRRGLEHLAIPEDCGLEEYERVIAGLMVYLRGGKYGRWVSA